MNLSQLPDISPGDKIIVHIDEGEPTSGEFQKITYLNISLGPNPKPAEPWIIIEFVDSDEVGEDIDVQSALRLKFVTEIEVLS